MGCRISRCWDNKDMEPYEESATQETEPAEDTHQAMLHGICTFACNVAAMPASDTGVWPCGPTHAAGTMETLALGARRCYALHIGRVQRECQVLSCERGIG